MNKYAIILLSMVGIGILGGAFYWYSYRPSAIMRDCSLEAKEKAIAKSGRQDGKYLPDDRDAYYKFCMQDHGLSE